MFRIGKFGKKVVSAVIAGAVVLGTLAVYPSETKSRVFAAANVLDYDSASSVNYNTILGRATDYGLLVGTMNQTGHMETTFATYKYIGETNNDVDLAGEAPSNIIIASVEPGSHPIFGKTRSSVFNIYTTKEIANIIEFDDNFNKGAVAFNNGQTPPSYSGSPSVNFHYQDEPALTENVKKMLEHTQQQSDMLAAKPSVDVSKLLKNGNVLDLSSEEFKGATIYVDVPAGSTIETLLRGADALTIKKYPSTNVVFNLKNTNLTINKFKVEVLNDNGTTKKTITSGDQQHSGDYSEHDADIEEYICKNIIFNAPNATKAKVMNTAGLFLFPKKADIIVNAAGGWLATPGKVTTEGEWHFFYQGRSKDINTPEKASFHFAAYKAFTTEFRGENTERLTNIYAGKDEYTFSFTETGSDYDTTGLTGTTVKTDENGYLFFPSLSVNIADVDPLNPQYHYYVIKETAVSSSSGMDAPSNGEMRMKVKVENNSGVIRFTIDHVTYLDSNHNEPKNVYKEEAGIVMSGTEFSLGAFINKVTIDKAKLSVTKEVYIDGNKAGADNATVRDAEFKYYLKKGNQYVQDLQGKLGGNPHEFKIKNGKIDKFENLNLGEYVIEEIKPGDLTGLDYSGNSITYANATSSGSTVTLAKDDNASATIRNDYTTVTITNNHSLQITKRATGLTPSYKDKEYRVSVKTSDGRYVQSLNGTIGTAEHYFTVKAGQTIKIINLPSGGYVISEDTQDARVINYDLTSSVTPDNVNISDTENNANVEVKNDYTQQKGKLSIRKTFSISNPVTDNLKFVITGPENFSKEVEYSKFTNGVYTLPEDLPCGVYTVSEVGADGTAPVGYFYFKTYSGMDYPADDSTECTVTVSNNQTVTAAFDNRYNEQQYGDLTVHKFVQRVGNISGIPDTFKIAIINSDGEYYDPAQSTDTNAVFTAAAKYCTITTVNDNGTFTARHLPAGSYRLIENRDGTEVAGAVLTVTGEGSVHVIGNQGNNVYLSNIYTMYKLTVRKQASNAPYTGNTYQIAVKKGDSYVQADGSVNSKVHYFDITANGSLTIPVQQSGTYEVFEKNENISENNFYELVTTYKVGDGEAASTHPSIELNDTNASYDVTVINTYTRKTKGYIDLTKTISGDVTQEDLDKLTFTVKDSEGKTVATLKLGEDFEKVPNSGEGTKGTYKLKDSKLIEVADASKTYTVEETMHTLDGFDVTVTNKIGGGSETTGTTANVTGGVSTDSTKPTEVAFENNYKKKTGSLILQKTVDGPAGCVDPDTEFTFYVKGEDGKWYDKNGDPSNDEVGIKIKAGDTNKITINNIPAQLYQIYEADASSQVETGYEYLSADSTKSLDGIAVPAGGSTTATLINKYKKSAPTTGSLTLKKTVEGPDGAVAADTEFTFYVHGEDGKWYDKDGKPSDTKVGIKIKAGDTNIITLNDLPVQKYDITEDDAASAAEAGYEFVSGTSTTYLNGVEVKAGETTPSELINKYTRSMGGLSLTKTIDGDTEGCNATEFTFYVKGADGKWYDKDGNPSDTEVGITVPADGTITITSIPVQKYTVTEADATGTAKTGYEFVLAESKVKDENVTVTKGAVASSELTNSYKKLVTKGYIDLTKTISGDVTQEDLDKLTFTVKDSDGKIVATLKLGEDFEKVPNSGEGTKGTYKLKDSKLIEVDDSTKTYTVVESMHTLDGFDVTVTNKIGSGSETAGETATVAGASTDSTTPTEVAFKNDYTKKTTKGYITLEKTISGDVTDEDLKGLTFTVKDSDGKTVATLKLGEDFEKVTGSGEGTKGTYKLKDSKLIEVADASKTYTVEETMHTLSGFDVTVTNKIGGGSETTGTTANVTGGVSTDSTKPTEVAFKNDYTRKPATGSLKLKKTISAPSGYTTTKTFNFYVKGESGKWYDKDGKPSDTEVYVTVPANGEVTISGLPLQKYDVTEADATATAETGYVYDKDNSTTAKRAVEVTATAAATAELINKYVVKTPDTGSLTLKKTVSGPSGSTTTNNFTFYVKGEDGKWYDKNGDPSTTQVGITVKGNDANGVTISGLPVQKYDITEDDGNAAAANGYELDGANSETSKDDVGVVKDKETTVILINAYKTKEVDKGKLILKKTVSGEAGGANTTKFTFYVKGEDGKWYDKDGKPSDTQVGITVDSSNADGVKIENLPVQKYNITEADGNAAAASGYELDGANSETSKDDVGVVKDQETTVTLVNAYKTKEVKTGSLILKKTVKGDTGCTTTTKFTFYVKGEDGKWYGADGKPSADKVAITVESTNADGVKIENLPVQKYDITEADASAAAASGYVLDGAASEISKNDAEVIKDKETTVTLVNAYKVKVVDKGSLVLKKKVTGPDGCTTTTKFTFYVKGEDGKWYGADGKPSADKVAITVESTNTDGVKIENLPVQKYDISEEDANKAAASGYELNGAASEIIKRAVEVIKDKETTVTLVNAYKTKEVDKGTLVLSKKLTNPDGCTTTSFTFYIKGADGKWYGADAKPSADKVAITVKSTDTDGVKIENLPVQTYTVTEADANKLAADGYELDGENSVTTRTNISVTKDQETSAQLVNAYKKSTVPETGSIKVSKTENGSVPASGIPTTYSFYIRSGSNYLKADGTFGAKADAKVFKVAPGGETEVTGLELGKTYAVEEASYNVPDGYSISVTYTSSQSVTLDSTNKTDSVKITNTYIKKAAPSAGSLVVTKRLAGSVAASGMPDTYRFYVKCGDLFVQNDGTLGEDKHMFEIAPNKSIAITGLDTDNKTYQVVEEPISNSDLPDGYKWSVSYSSESVTLKDPDDSGDITIINSYTHKAPSPNEDKGNLELKKTVQGPAGCTNTSSFTFYVKGADKKWYDKNATAHTDKTEITVKAGETVKITGLPVQTYTITESNPANTAADGYEIDGNKSVPTRVNVEVVKDGTAEAELINVYKKSVVDTGSLTLKKKVEGPAGCTNTNDFTFYVKGADGKWYDKDGKASSTQVGITVKGNDTNGVKIDNIPVQKYDITEADGNKAAADGYELDGTASDVFKNDVAVTKDDNTAVTLTNSYKKSVVDTGSLTLKKKVEGPAGCTNTNDFTFYVKGADGKWYGEDGKASSTQVGITVKGNDTNGVTITGIPVQKYDITEADGNNAAAAGYELNGAASDVFKNDVAVTKDKNTTVTLTNEYKTKTAQETGDIILKKTVTGETGGAKTTNFTFYVKGADGKWYDKNGTASSTRVGITVSSTDTNGVTITGIPAQKYDVTEDTDNTAADGYELDGNASETSKTGVVVTKDTTPEVTLINSYKKSSAPETGSLTLKKTVTGETGGAKTTNFTFYVKGADGKWYDKNGTASSTRVGITVSSTDTNGVTITGIPVQKYDITEETNNTASDGFELDTVNSTTSRSGVTVTATKPGEATLINSYKRSSTGPEKGNLAFSKTFGGDIKESEAAASGIYFVIEKTDATGADKYLKLDGTFTSSATEAQIKLAALLHTAGSLKWSVQIDDIPVGKYKVTEYNAKVMIDGTSIELVLVTGSSVVSQTCNVTKGATGSLDLINNYKVSDYDVKISKQDIAKKELPKATLTLTSLDGHDLSGAVVKQGSKTIKVTLSADKKSISFVTGTTPSLITGLKYGKYELKETVTPEAYLTADAIKFSIDRAGRLYDENGSVIVSGSPIVMIDKADPNYKKPTPSGNNKVPATGVGTSYAPFIGMFLVAISVACATAVVIFRTKKRKL